VTEYEFWKYVFFLTRGEGLDPHEQALREYVRKFAEAHRKQDTVVAHG
jgi:hypothetical protein